MNRKEKGSTFQKIALELASQKRAGLRKILCIAFAALSMIAVLLTLFSDLCIVVYNTGYADIEYGVSAIGAFGEDALDGGTKIMQIAAFFAIMLSLCIGIVMLIRALSLMKKESAFAKRIRRLIFLDVIFVAVFTFACCIVSPINEMVGGVSMSNVSLLPLIIAAVTGILYSVYLGFLRYAEEEEAEKEDDQKAEHKKSRRRKYLSRLELFLYTIVSSAIALVALLSNIITVKFESSYAQINEISLTGIKLLSDAAALEEGHRALRFMIFAALLIICVLLFLCIVSFFSSSGAFRRLSVASLATSVAVCLAVGLFSKYYEMVQDLNEGLIADMLSDSLGGEILNDAFTYTVSSASIYYFLISVAILALVLLRNSYSSLVLFEEGQARESAASAMRAPSAALKASSSAPAQSGEGGTSGFPAVFDPCPAFSVLDRKSGEFQNLLGKKREALFENPTLQSLVEFIVQYARDCRLHLFYTEESIATFLAGLGATRLTVLQGMSGTGKTSLPKIVSEALMSVCDIVEVESSWRDKNELLGYYNEFSRTYTPKKFTQSLYKAALNPEVLTFIVLDEMNLSRIEYYFSDFLSIMENEPDKREIKLLNVPLFKKEGDIESEYLALEDGFTLKIPNNVWFIGTANRDESTYDISDKVYDRAHTMNFDKRAAAARSYNDPCGARFLPVSALQKLFDEAKAQVEFDLDRTPVVAEVEKLLAPYNISFGNRIALQMQNFVKIYAACFSGKDFAIRDALEVILLSKVVRKIELKSIDDPEGLAESFKRLQLYRCAEFIEGIKES